MLISSRAPLKERTMERQKMTSTRHRGSMARPSMFHTGSGLEPKTPNNERSVCIIFAGNTLLPTPHPGREAPSLPGPPPHTQCRGHHRLHHRGFVMYVHTVMDTGTTCTCTCTCTCTSWPCTCAGELRCTSQTAFATAACWRRAWYAASCGALRLRTWLFALSQNSLTLACAFLSYCPPTRCILIVPGLKRI